MSSAEREFQAILDAYRESLKECELLYSTSAQQVLQNHPHALDRSPREFVDWMADLHKGLVLKIYVVIMEADLRWSDGERRIAAVLFHHVWNRRLSEDELRVAVGQIAQESAKLSWMALIRPFVKYRCLRDRGVELEAAISRMANLVAKVDGVVSVGESLLLRQIPVDIRACLQAPADSNPASERPASSSSGRKASSRSLRDAIVEPPPLPSPPPSPPSSNVRTVTPARSTEHATATDSTRSEGPTAANPESKTGEERLEDAMRRLGGLIGLERVKHEVRTLANLLHLQRERRRMGLPTTPMNLHMIYSGNPGTGKTTVARLVGDILAAMGILERGHLVEADRSALVAEFAGQTAPKTAKLIDDALDGVLFIDEAYSLVAKGGDDPYGAEAVQVLLKRMEDQRDRLVVILAGYPRPMQELLQSNVGLASRFSLQWTFEDYSPRQLGLIFQSMCDRNHFTIDLESQLRLLGGFAWLYRRRNDQFGNGRLVRNLFERAVRQMANRIAGQAPLTSELLSTFRPADIVFEEIADDRPDGADAAPNGVVVKSPFECPQQFQFVCDHCQGKNAGDRNLIGQKARCGHCGERFVANWGEPG